MWKNNEKRQLLWRYIQIRPTQLASLLCHYCFNYMQTKYHSSFCLFLFFSNEVCLINACCQATTFSAFVGVWLDEDLPSKNQRVNVYEYESYVSDVEKNRHTSKAKPMIFFKYVSQTLMILHLVIQQSIKLNFIFLNLGRSTLNQQRSPGTQMRHLGHLAWNIILGEIHMTMQQSRTWKTNVACCSNVFSAWIILLPPFFFVLFFRLFIQDKRWLYTWDHPREIFQFSIKIYVSLQRQYVGVFSIVHSTVPKSSLEYC